MKFECLFKGHCFKVVDVGCQGVPYAGVKGLLEFVDYKAIGKCGRCEKQISDYGRARVAYFRQPVSPVLASTPSWILDNSENREAIIKAVETYLKRR
jgi:hypothetical protein